MISKYQKEIDQFLLSGGTINKERYDGEEIDFIQESVMVVKDLEPHEVTAISWGQAMAESDGEEDDTRYWANLNRTLDDYIQKNNVPVLPSSKLYWGNRLDNIESVCYYNSIVNESMMNPNERDYEAKWDEESKESDKL